MKAILFCAAAGGWAFAASKGDVFLGIAVACGVYVVATFARGLLDYLDNGRS